MSECSLMRGGPGVCHWCGGELPGRRRKWCSDECERLRWANHWWSWARAERLRVDSWTCVRCGFVGWWDAPRSLTGMVATDFHLDPIGTSLEDWAVALGLIEPRPDFPIWNPHHNARLDHAIEQIPDSIRTLVSQEGASRRGYDRASMRHGPGTHQLEVNHIEPRRGRGYASGCHNHVDKLETLCRPCHVEETTRQRRGLPSWHEDPRPLEAIESEGTLLEALPIRELELHILKLARRARGGGDDAAIT